MNCPKCQKEMVHLNWFFTAPEEVKFEGDSIQFFKPVERVVLEPKYRIEANYCPSCLHLQDYVSTLIES